MKATRKLIPAFAMLLIAAVMMSTATFAWFSTNATVTATGMTVTAKAASTFLVISSENNAGFKEATYQEITDSAAAAVDAENVLVPISFTEATQTWEVATALTPGASTAKEETRKPATPGFETGTYLFKRTFYFRIATNFADANDLKLTKVEVAGNTDYADCVSVVAVPGGANVWTVFNSYDAAASTNKITNTQALHATVGQTVVAVDVYVFIDGEHAKVYTENVTNLSNLGVTLTFGVGEPTT